MPNGSGMIDAHHHATTMKADELHDLLLEMADEIALCYPYAPYALTPIRSTQLIDKARAAATGLGERKEPTDDQLMQAWQRGCEKSDKTRHPPAGHIAGLRAVYELSGLI